MPYMAVGGESHLQGVHPGGPLRTCTDSLEPFGKELVALLPSSPRVSLQSIATTTERRRVVLEHKLVECNLIYQNNSITNYFKQLCML